MRLTRTLHSLVDDVSAREASSDTMVLVPHIRQGLTSDYLTGGVFFCVRTTIILIHPVLLTQIHARLHIFCVEAIFRLYLQCYTGDIIHIICT